jgi:exodeoxyribonuclease V alpha subunit
MNSIADPLAEFLGRASGNNTPLFHDAIRMLCRALAEGHVCIPIRTLPEGAEAALRASSAVGAPGDFRPLIFEGENLYLARYQHYETRLAEQLRARASHVDQAPDSLIRARLAKMTDDKAQQQAVVAALRRRLCIITGGPGTGKTRTATIALTLLAEHLAAAKPRIALAAPTGKAAARLSTSLADTLAQFNIPANLARVPSEAQTLHRLLGAIPGESRFRFNAERLLPVDVLVVDEASMIDLPLMTKMLDALHPEARLILLGDRNQLASVEAGHVLGDICSAAAGPLRECITELTTNHRFSAQSGIQHLAALVHSGDYDAAEETLKTRHSDLSARLLPRRIGEALGAPLVQGWKDIASATNPADALARLNDFRILCALRDGPQGVVHLNRVAEQVLSAAGLISPTGPFYHGRPVLILRNDSSTRLFNGDLGILLRDELGELRAWFPGENNEIRSLAPSQLPEHETAFAMTVHKSQGSEFASALVILPEIETPILSREHLYTAITRAKSHIQLWWTEASLAAALRRRVTRWSGLRDRFSAAP